MMEAVIRETAVLAGASALAACFILVLVSAFRRSPKGAPPIVRVGMPVLGNIRAYVRSPIKLITHCHET